MVKEQDQKRPRRLDNIEDLFIGRIAEAKGTLETDQGPLRATFWGEVLMYGRVKDGKFDLDQLRRVALYGQLDEPSRNEHVGIFTLASYAPRSQDDIELTLHYAALTEESQPRFEENTAPENDAVGKDDAVVPLIERISAHLSLEPGEVTPSTVDMRVGLLTTELLEQVLDTRVIDQVKLDSTPARFHVAGNGAVPPKVHYSLPSKCPSPPMVPCPVGQETVTRTLALKFINFSEHSLTDTDVAGTGRSIEDLCEAQLSGVCEVWRNRSALDLVVQTSIEEGTANQKQKFGVCSRIEEGQIIGYEPTFTSPTRLEIFLVNRLVRWPNGGVTHDVNQSSAYCILALKNMDENPFLLAHEICHVAGLAHPDGVGGFILGSPNSIADPGGSDLTRQTVQNLQVFTDNSHPLNPLVATSNLADCFHPGPEIQ